MRFFSRDKPKIKVQTTKRDSYSGWLKCTSCNELIHSQELEQNQNCCPKCEYHYRLSASLRIANLTDPDSFKEMFTNINSTDPLNFVDSEPYIERIKKNREKTGSDEAILVGKCRIMERSVLIGVFNFSFMGGSMGSVVGEKLTLLIEHAMDTGLPLVIVSTSGGARMQESTLSLMQMAKTSAALKKLNDKGIPYISILTNPTSGGVTASFASLGDIIIAEPNSLICFAGPRLIEQTIGQKLPDDAQKSEFLLQHGMIDCIVKRHNLKKYVAKCLDLLMGKPKKKARPQAKVNQEEKKEDAK